MLITHSALSLQWQLAPHFVFHGNFKVHLGVISNQMLLYEQMLNDLKDLDLFLKWKY